VRSGAKTNSSAACHGGRRRCADCFTLNCIHDTQRPSNPDRSQRRKTSFPRPLIVDEAETTHEIIQITRHGRVAAGHHVRR